MLTGVVVDIFGGRFAGYCDGGSDFTLPTRTLIRFSTTYAALPRVADATQLPPAAAFWT